ncbi:hypothetical protein EsVE80_24310 [Enterococcus saigonensis]|uniref:Uncharacterized protein n=1 Tax=Enterococcus saigonensis TaxID=1805431 RepID=A0A679IB78_9ENTE|nr:hypothetical protein [Enterococcus saigonensis]BCA86908.1 hypothetical protein EsVE80_24310 [Enterococcus saigonensis]
MFEIFEELNLHVTEMPVEVIEDVLIYRGFLRELPQIAAEGHSRQALYRQLAEKYAAYRESLLEESSEEVQTTSLLSATQLLKYYDGETFDGFSLEE